MQTVENAIVFLLKEANIAIRYRVVKELYNDTRSVEYFKLKQELENSLNMLIDMGFMYGMGFEAFDEVVKSLKNEVQNRKREGTHVLRYLPDIVAIPFLLRAGVRELWLIEFVKERIDIIYSFVEQKSYDIYEDTELYKGIPKNFQDRFIIRPELYENAQIRLPLEYDIYGMACLYIELPLNYKYKVDEIISYIMNEKFFQVQDRYGILSDKNRYWALGWDPKPSKLEETRGANPLLLKMVISNNLKKLEKAVDKTDSR